eukprot:TRINITY_DN10890_c0_g1_i2.p1 TRINITY_DN10890_c0_g1~~TRINITY_DN10890_c0_g1_i2.p1  ORF type:complete len:858 (-),score=279.00 TRINITY_DN10890_c0_g1_i2:28-2349(-)
MRKMVAEEMTRLEGFLAMAETGSDYREQVALIAQMGDVHLVNEPITASRLYNCAIAVARKHEIYDEIDPLFVKLTQAELRVCAIHNLHSHQIDSDKYVATQRKRQQELQNIRANYELKRKQMEGFALQAWLSNKIDTLLRSVCKDVFSFTGAPPLTSFAILLLGDYGRNEATPHSALELAIVISSTSLASLESMRMCFELLQVRIANLGETAHGLFNHGTVSPVPKGLQLEESGSIPWASKRGSLFRLVDTPYHLALLQEQRFFDLDVAAAMEMAMGARFLYGEKKLMAAYQTEVNRILNRSQAASSTMLRHDRACDLIRSEAARFRPLYNKASDDEKYFDFRPILALPHKTIRYLALYFGGPHVDKTSARDLVEVLVSKKCFSKKGGSNLKRALELIDKVRVASGDQPRFDIRRVIRDMKEKYRIKRATAAKPAAPSCDDDEAESAEGAAGGSAAAAEDGADTSAAEAPEEAKSAEAGEGGDAEGASSSAGSDNGEKVGDASAAEVSASEEQSKPPQGEEASKSVLFSITEDHVEDLVEIYKVLIPYWKCLTKFNKQRSDVFEKHHLLYTDERTIAEAYFRLCMYDEAEAHYLQAVEENPEDSTLMNEIGMMWNKMAQYDKSITWFQKTVDLIRRPGPELSGAYTNIGMCYVHKKEYEEAVEWLKKALKVDEEVHGEKHPHVAQDHHYIGKISHRAGLLADAVLHLKKALEIHVGIRGEYSPESGRYNNDLGTVYEEMGDTDAVIPPPPFFFFLFFFVCLLVLLPMSNALSR